MNHLFLYFCSFKHCLMNNYEKYCSWIKIGTRVLLLFILMFSVFSCKPDQLQDNEQNNRLHSDTIKNEYAKGFQIIYRQNDTKINIVDPLTQEIISSYLLNEDDLEENNVISPYINRIVAMSTSQVGILRALHMEDKIVGVANFKDLFHPLNQSKVKEVGYIRSTNPENFIKVQPDIILYSGFDMSNPILNKLEQAGLKTFLIYDWKETHPLGRAEWIKVFGILLNKEKEAHAIFNKITTQYHALVKKLNQAKTQPTVLAGTYFSGVFNAPAGNSYMAQLLKDANVNYVYADTDGTGSLSLSLEEVVNENKETEFWLNAAASTKTDLIHQNQKLKHIRAFKSGKLYSYFNRKNYFFEKASIYPQLVLEDLGKIFYPQLFDDRKLNFYAVIGH